MRIVVESGYSRVSFLLSPLRDLAIVISGLLMGEILKDF